MTARTRLIYFSHISSPTALTFPVEELCRRASDHGILTFVDGAHAPGQIPLDLVSLGADFYTGNCHKWMMSPKGAGFLYADRAVQPLIEPFVVSWGYSSQPGVSTGRPFLDNLQWLGTNDLSAYLAVPAAIDFMAAHGWDTVREECHALLRETLNRLADELSFKQTYSACSEIPVTRWRDCDLIRISIQGYNTAGDVDALVAALADLL